MPPPPNRPPPPLKPRDPNSIVYEDTYVPAKPEKLDPAAEFEQLMEEADREAEALDRLKKERFDIVFMDCQMPEMDGYEVLMAMKEQGLNILTVVVSGDIQPNAHHRVLELGAIDFIQKPCSPEKLADIIISD